LALNGRNKLRDLIESESPAERTLSIARAFVSARQRAVPLADYPGPLPADMEAAYAVQEAAIGLWQDRIVGWKIGLVAPSEQATLGTSRLAGPIFLQGFTRVAGAVPEPVRLAAIPGGFAAIEAELLVTAHQDAPVDKTHWTLEEAAAFAGDWHLGVEFAASPLATINELGAAVVVSDFGNNSGLVVGPRLDAASVAVPAQLTCQTRIDGKQVGRASVTALPGGPLEALRFLLGHLAKRGRSLRAGQWVSTGAITGVHRILPGQQGSVELLGQGRVDVTVVAAAERRTVP
jgi:2-keto-4-pentenoate hydratase